MNITTQKSDSVESPAPSIVHGGSMKYIPSLDGVRALAILAVIAFHLMPRVFRGGFTGVDVFFVLSGYLITSVILHDLREQRFSMREFYLRRVQRLLPNAVVMVFVTLLVLRLFLLPSMATSAAAHGVWALLNLSNIYIWRTLGGYWGDSAVSAPLLHTWSLAVEEQFYLLFPLTLVLLARRKGLLLATICLTVASFALGVYVTAAHPEAAFYLLPTRAWEPLLGAVLAIVRVPLNQQSFCWNVGSRREAEIVGWGGLSLIIAGFVFIANGNHFPGSVALVPAIGSLLLLASVAKGDTTLSRWFSTPFMVRTGRASYSLYLWHWPFIVIGEIYASLAGGSEQLGRLVGLAVGVTLALIAYRFVEMPLRARGNGRKRRLLLIATAFSVSLASCLALSVWHPAADPLHRFDQPVFYGLSYSVGSGSTAQVRRSARYYDVLFSDQPHHSGIWKDGGIIHEWGGGVPQIVVLGSSHALMYGRLIDEICEQQHLSVAFLSADATSVFSPVSIGESFPTRADARSFDEARRYWVRTWHPKMVIVIDRWDEYSEDRTGFDEKLSSLVDELVPYTKTILITSQPPVLGVDPAVNLREYVTWYIKNFGRLPEIEPDAKEPFRRYSVQQFDKLRRQFPQLEVLRIDQIFRNGNGSIRFSAGRKFLYADNNHLSQAGAEMAKNLFAQAIKGVRVHPSDLDNRTIALPEPLSIRP